ncbi:Excinuclease ABC subunit C [Alloalcanivorax dieselolei B5]|uniref:Excinuclease ABC subunit C n=1 Tax=Alcanivorax dieselolei (strain DSM 16502 / CGMCC 1.3690 / MCCC 1A00001 / B-5) TaxID=930169 RepID=K0CG06_ALCDB|nr:TerC family protein [Alloalcanivorax dieselolei]AFT71568.1 Excinuclease ABC subunit C [Alloalcanivorax dieselolei B5]GGJ89884.1 membrane protein [Alloalcanivorax dieselolei]
MLEWMTSPEAWVALATLTALEIVLGIDNIIFLSILVDRLPERQRPKARLIGLSLAMIMRLLLLASLAWLTRLTADWFTVLGQGISGRDLVLILGGLFLLAKSVMEIHHSIDDVGEQHQFTKSRGSASFLSILVQIALLDVVFSLDSVITAVGMANHLEVMVIAVVIAVGFMMVFANAIGNFVTEHPTLKMLALAFLVLVGTALVADGLDFHIPKGYIYFAMAFSFGVEMLNLRMSARRRQADSGD